MRDFCGVVMPFKEPQWVSFGEEMPGCLRKRDHDGEHLMQNKDGVCVTWAPLEEYCEDLEGCECYQEMGPMECFQSGEITPEEARKILEEDFPDLKKAPR